MPRARSGGPEGQWKLAGGVSHRGSKKMVSAPVGVRENDRHAIGTFSTPLARRVHYQRPDSRIAAAWRERLHAYLGGVVRNVNVVPEAIGGIADHVHLLIGLRATACLADVVRDVKAVSSRWVMRKSVSAALHGREAGRLRHGWRVAAGYRSRIHRAAGVASSKADILGGIHNS